MQQPVHSSQPENFTNEMENLSLNPTTSSVSNDEARANPNVNCQFSHAGQRQFNHNESIQDSFGYQPSSSLNTNNGYVSQFSSNTGNQNNLDHSNHQTNTITKPSNYYGKNLPAVIGQNREMFVSQNSLSNTGIENQYRTPPGPSQNNQMPYSNNQQTFGNKFYNQIPPTSGIQNQIPPTSGIQNQDPNFDRNAFRPNSQLPNSSLNMHQGMFIQNQGPPLPNMNGPPRPQLPTQSQGPPIPNSTMQGFPNSNYGQNQFPPGSMTASYTQGPQMPTNFPTQPTLNPSMGQQNFGAPPMPQQTQNGYSQPGYPNQSMMSPPQARISPDLLPDVVNVIQNDRENQGSGVFETSQRGITPPLVTTNFICRDGGNCNPRFIRSSLYNIPTTSDILNQVGVNFTLTCSPFAKLNISDSPVLISDMGVQGPVRCIRCKAYMNPYNIFIDGGRKFQCALCTATSDVPDTYFAHVDHTGRRTDAMQRPELCLGSYEIYATKEYCRNNTLPKAPAYIFLLDVSQPAIRSGFLQMFCSRFVNEVLPNLPKPELSANQREAWLMANHGADPATCPNYVDIPISFITYGNQLNFFSFVTSKQFPNGPQSEPVIVTKPQMHIVADMEDMFVPGVEGFLISSANKKAIENLMNIIPNQFVSDANGMNSPSQVTLLGPAIQAGLETLKACERPGKLFVFHTCLPTADVPGRLKNREDAKIIGTDKEMTLLEPANSFYSDLGQKCVQFGCSIDYFLMPTSYVDIATIAETPKLTGGRIYKYPCFQADRQGDDIINDLSVAIGLPQAFDCVMKVRTSTGTRPVDFLGNAHIPNSTDIEVACVDSDWGLTVEIKHDDKLNENDIVLIQMGVLFTSLSGERRLRVHNLALPTSNKPTDIFFSADLDAFINYLAKLTIKAIVKKRRQVVFDELTNKVCHCLVTYKKACCSLGNNQGSNPGELILPERLKLLPYFVQSFFKTPIIKSGSACQLHHSDPHAAALLSRQLGNEIGLDTRSLTLFHINRMDVLQTATYFYPRVYSLHNLISDSESMPTVVRCSIERFKSDGVYLVDNGGYNRFLWLGNDVSPTWLADVFEVNSPRSVPDGAIITEKPNETSQRLCQALKMISEGQTRSAKLIVVRQNTEQEAWMKMFMYEDRASDNTPSYGEYLVHVHKEVRSIVK